MPYILPAARAIMTLLSPMTGTVATGDITVTATGADVVLEKNCYGIPIIPGVGASGQLSPHVLLKTTEGTTVTAAGVDVPVKAVLGGVAANLDAGTEVRWSPAIDGIDAVSVVAAGGLTGGLAPTGYGGVKQIRFYEQIGPAQAQADMFRAQLGAWPAIALIWSSTEPDDRRGTHRRTYRENWLLVVISSRTDSDDERRAEGLFILEEARELLTNRQQADGFSFSSPSGLELGRADRLVATPQSYIYVQRFSTEHTIVKRESREYPFWETFKIDADTASGEDPEVPIVDEAIYPMPDPEE